MRLLSTSLHGDLDATRQIRLLPRHNQTPILAMTANAFAEDLATCTGARIGLGVLAPTPMRARNGEAILKGQKVTEEILRKAGKAAAEECKARDSIRGEAWYRREMVEVLVPRMARLAMERAR